MKSVEKLNDLPTEILFKIFDYIPNRWNLSLVCWDFYEIVCEIEKNQFCFKLIDVSCCIYTSVISLLIILILA